MIKTLMVDPCCHQFLDFGPLLGSYSPLHWYVHDMLHVLNTLKSLVLLLQELTSSRFNPCGVVSLTDIHSIIVYPYIFHLADVISIQSINNRSVWRRLVHTRCDSMPLVRCSIPSPVSPLVDLAPDSSDRPAHQPATDESIWYLEHSILSSCPAMWGLLPQLRELVDSYCTEIYLIKIIKNLLNEVIERICLLSLE